MMEIGIVVCDGFLLDWERAQENSFRKTGLRMGCLSSSEQS